MKTKRHDAILEIIKEKDISTQEELQRELSLRGYEVTQATVSRDIRRLRLVKRQADDGRNIYTASAKKDEAGLEKFVRVLKDSVRSVEAAQNILVIKTESGMAMAAAAAIDSLPISNVVGCIAGDDTIMAVLKTNEAAENARNRLISDLLG